MSKDEAGVGAPSVRAREAGAFEANDVGESVGAIGEGRGVDGIGGREGAAGDVVGRFTLRLAAGEGFFYSVDVSREAVVEAVVKVVDALLAAGEPVSEDGHVDVAAVDHRAGEQLEGSAERRLRGPVFEMRDRWAYGILDVASDDDHEEGRIAGLRVPLEAEGICQ